MSFYLIAFIGGLLTILAPCILAVLPILLGTTLGNQNKLRPIMIVLGLIVSFTFFGVAFSYLTDLFGISSNTFRNIALVLLVLFGVGLIFPTTFEKIYYAIQNVFAKLHPNKASTPSTSDQKKNSLLSAFLIGTSLGLVWAPCAGPILASILILAKTQQDLIQVALLMLSYSLGAGIPMLLIAYGGNWVIKRLKFFKQQGQNIQKGAGVVLIIGVILIATGLDTKIQTALFSLFPKLGMIEEELAKNIPSESLLSPSNTNQSTNSEIPDLHPKGTKAPELSGLDNWINSEPLTLSQLKGKVVIIDFWTYSCINCQRTLPYLKTWYKTYQDQGLVIIGVHAPEFAFEEDLNNVKKAVTDAGITYPVVQDNKFTTWKIYKNRYWPAKYIIDAEGNLRYTHFGEGKYEETERVIQTLLKEHNQSLSFEKTTTAGVDETMKTMFEKIKTPETYLGFDRNQYQENPTTNQSEQTATFIKPETLTPNHFYLEGDWLVQSEYIEPVKNSSLTINYTANKVNLVLKPVNNQPGKIKLLLDNKPLTKEQLGTDANEAGEITINEARLYNLVSTKDRSETHNLTIIFKDQNSQAFAFTFG